MTDNHELDACERTLGTCISELARLLQAMGISPAATATAIRLRVDALLKDEVGPTLQRDEMPRADRAVLDALERLEPEPGAPIHTTRAGLAVEASVRPITLDCTLC